MSLSQGPQCLTCRQAAQIRCRVGYSVPKVMISLGPSALRWQPRIRGRSCTGDPQCVVTDERPAPVGGVREAWVGRPPILGPHGPILEDSLSRGHSDSHGPRAVGSAWEVRGVLEEERPPRAPRACEVGQVRPRELHGILRPGRSGAADLDPGTGTLQPQGQLSSFKNVLHF